MRINDFLNESERLDEKPLGFLSSLKDKTLAGFGSSQAAGRLEASEEAKRMRDAFYAYLGKTGQTAEPEVVLGFLKHYGYPTKSAERILSEPDEEGTLSKLGKGISSFVQKRKSQPDNKQGPQASEPVQQELPLDNPNSPQTDLFDPNAGTAPMAAPAAKTKPSSIKKSQEQPVRAKVSKNGIKISGAGKPRIKAKVQTASKENTGTVIAEALSKNKLNKIFLAAVQDAIARDEGGMKQKESINKRMSEGQIYLLFKQIETVNNQWLEDKIVFESAFDAIRHSDGGNNLSTRITESELVQAWKRTDMSMDTQSLSALFKELGVNSNVVSAVYSNMLKEW